MYILAILSFIGFPKIIYIDISSEFDSLTNLPSAIVTGLNVGEYGPRYKHKKNIKLFVIFNGNIHKMQKTNDL